VQVTPLRRTLWRLVPNPNALVPPVLRYCWLGGRKGTQPVKNGGMVEVGTG